MLGAPPSLLHVISKSDTLLSTRANFLCYFRSKDEESIVKQGVIFNAISGASKCHAIIFIYLFTCGLFNDTTCKSDYTALKQKKIISD